MKNSMYNFIGSLQNKSMYQTIQRPLNPPTYFNKNMNYQRQQFF
jgi:hypothetical protein